MLDQNEDLEDSDVMDDDFMTDVILHDTKQDNLIMCCCCPEITHDETMKFTLKVSPEYEEKTRRSLLDSTLFKKQPDG